MTKHTDLTLLRYLPAIYQRPENAATLVPFLQPFEEVLTAIGEMLSGVDHLFDPANAPEKYLPWLASWVALELDDKWDLERQREEIANAMELYQLRGTVKGLKRAIEIFDSGLRVEVKERSGLGKMQIGVISRIGSLTMDATMSGCPPTDVQVVQMECQEPVYHDYYVVDTEMQAGQLWHITQTENCCQIEDQEVVVGAPIRYYYRTDRVHSIGTGQRAEERGTLLFSLDQKWIVVLDRAESVSESLRQEFRRYGISLTEGALIEAIKPGNRWAVADEKTKYLIYRRQDYLDVHHCAVRLTLTSGAQRYHEPASVKRLRRIAQNRYSLVDSKGREAQFVGDTFLTDGLDDPYQFVIGIGIPVGWLRLSNCEMQFDLDEWFTEASLREAIGHLLRNDGGVIRIEERHQGQAWMVDTMKRTGVNVQRIGWALYVYDELARTFSFPMVWLNAATDLDRKAVDQTIRDVFGQSHQPDIILPDNEIELDIEPHSCRWIRFNLSSSVDSAAPGKKRAFLITRDGSRLTAYERVEDAKWKSISQSSAHQHRSDLADSDAIREIHSVVDEIKPAHIQYALRFRPVLDLGRVEPKPLGVETDRVMIGVNMIIG